MPGTYELLVSPRLQGHVNAARIYEAAARGLAAAGKAYRIVSKPSWQGNVVMWGLGHPEGQELLREARSRPGIHVIGFDLAYWNREGPNPSFRVSFDSAHPQAFVMRRAMPGKRWEMVRIKLGSGGDPDGPILLVGMGYKSAQTYGEEPGEWERRTYRAIRTAWPDKQIVFRPKRGGKNERPISGIQIAGAGSIESLLGAVSLVVCRHSNVAVDAIIAGIPAIAEDGAASAVLGNSIVGPQSVPALDDTTRLCFLRNLAWFQYTFDELARSAPWLWFESILAE